MAEKTYYDIFLEHLEDKIPGVVDKENSWNKDMSKRYKGIKNLGLVLIKGEERPNGKGKDPLEVWRKSEYERLRVVRECLSELGYKPTKGSSELLDNPDPFNDPLSTMLIYDIHSGYYEHTDYDALGEKSRSEGTNLYKVMVGYVNIRLSSVNHILQRIDEIIGLTSR